jgi:hypothetical protein
VKNRRVPLNSSLLVFLLQRLLTVTIAAVIVVSKKNYCTRVPTRFPDRETAGIGHDWKEDSTTTIIIIIIIIIITHQASQTESRAAEASTSSE